MRRYRVYYGGGGGGRKIDDTPADSTDGRKTGAIVSSSSDRVPPFRAAPAVPSRPFPARAPEFSADCVCVVLCIYRITSGCNGVPPPPPGARLHLENLIASRHRPIPNDGRLPLRTTPQQYIIITIIIITRARQCPDTKPSGRP